MYSALSPPVGFFLYFQPRVDVVFEETQLQIGEMPEFVNSDMKNLVAPVGCPQPSRFLGCIMRLEGLFLGPYMHAICQLVVWSIDLVRRRCKKGHFVSLLVMKHGMV